MIRSTLVSDWLGTRVGSTMSDTASETTSNQPGKVAYVFALKWSPDLQTYDIHGLWHERGLGGKTPSRLDRQWVHIYD